MRTMYGLSFTASFVCASATRRFASATRRCMSSPGAGDAECEVDSRCGVLAGLGLATADADADAETDTGAELPDAPFFMAAIFAAISARFCAMRSAAACTRVPSQRLRGEDGERTHRC